VDAANLAPMGPPPDASFFEPYERFLASALSISSRTLSAFFESVAKMLEHNPPTSPCSKPTCTVSIDPFTNETSLSATIRVARPFAQLVPILDPRSWSTCSDLFTKTDQVHDPPDSSFSAIRPPVPNIGQRWNGLLFERAESGQQQVENILRIDFNPAAPPTTAAGNDILVTYDLFRSISYCAGALRLPGMMRQNRGYLRASPVNAGLEATLEVTKTVKYGRLSSWSGSRIIDYGEILNYVARALFAEWVHHLETFVGCCQSP